MSYKKWSKFAGLALLLVNLVVMQGVEPLQAQSRQQNYNTVIKTGIGGAGVMVGLGAAACMALTAGGCGAIIASGALLGAIGGTLSAMGDPPADAPDYYIPSPNGDCDFGCDSQSGTGGMGAAGNPAAPSGGYDSFDSWGGYSEYNLGVPE